MNPGPNYQISRSGYTAIFKKLVYFKVNTSSHLGTWFGNLSSIISRLIKASAPGCLPRSSVCCSDNPHVSRRERHGLRALSATNILTLLETDGCNLRAGAADESLLFPQVHNPSWLHHQSYIMPPTVSTFLKLLARIPPPSSLPLLPLSLSPRERS